MEPNLLYHYVAAQPDKPAFVWQLKVLLTSMKKLHIPKECIHLLILLEERDALSPEMAALEADATLHVYEDREEYRGKGKKRLYGPSSKPYLFGRFYEEIPILSQSGRLFFIESDMLLHKIPVVPLDTNTWYWSNAENYLEVGVMEDIVGAPIASKAFGFHMIGGQGVTPEWWYNVEKESIALYLTKHIHNIDVNPWIAEMRAWMYNSLKLEGVVHHVIHPELDFHTGGGIKWGDKNLHHQLSRRGFNKRKYRGQLEPWGDAAAISVAPNFQLSDYIKGIVDAGRAYGHLPA